MVMFERESNMFKNENEYNDLNDYIYQSIYQSITAHLNTSS